MWLINNQIIFDPEHRTLKDDRVQFQLSSSAARCLELFLQRPGEVISHEALLEEGWRSQGVHVTDNSLRQVLSVLRKQFMQLRVEGETFVTVHRQGYRLHHSMQVEPYASAVDVSPEPLLPEFPVAVAQPPAQAAPIFAPPAVSAATAPAPGPAASAPRIGLVATIMLGMLGCAVLLLVLALLGIKVVELRDVVTVNYSRYRVEDGRQWYIQEDFTSLERAELEKLLPLMRQQLTELVQLEEMERHIYINRTQLTDRFSWFICHQPIENKDASCRSALSFVAG